MDVFEKLMTFSINMPFESAEETWTSPADIICKDEPASLKYDFPITHAHLPDGKTIPLLKTMQTSVCERDCNYCCFRSGRDTPRATLTPDKLAKAVDSLSRAGIAKGVFLSSGIAGSSISTQDRIIVTAETLRKKYNYTGYIHLKIMPGAQEDQIFRAMQLADRVSINLEGPNETSLKKLAPHKIFFNELLKPLHFIEKIRQSQPAQLAWNNRWPSSCTQFVVGAVDETDLDLLQTTIHLQSKFKISRAYYSKFTPVINTPFENLPPLNTWRQHRLYQAFFLLRDYQFNLEDIRFSSTGHLAHEKDPKLAWAENNLLGHPIEINTATYQQLLKIPGIGPKSAHKLIKSRVHGKIRDMNTLKMWGIASARASRFILLDGHPPAYQPGLFPCDQKN